MGEGSRKLGNIWGFLDKKAFATARGQTLTGAIAECLRSFQSLSRQMRIGPILYDGYENWLADPGGRLLPAAVVLRRYAATHPDANQR